MSTTKEEVDKLVLDYLLSNGYTKAAAELVEQQKIMQSTKATTTIADYVVASSSMDDDSSPRATDVTSKSGSDGNNNSNNNNNNSISHFKQDLVVFGIEKGNGRVYFTEYEAIRNWAYESLDFVKDELMEICFPIFVHCLLGLHRLQESNLASEFWMKWSNDHRLSYADELSSLANIVASDFLLSNEFLSQNDFIREALKSKFHVTISEFSFNLLSSYLIRNNLKIVSAILNDKLFFEPFRSVPISHGQIITLPNYQTSQKQGVNTSFDLPAVFWGVPGTGALVDQSSMFPSLGDHFRLAMPNTKTDKTYCAWIDKIIRPKLLSGEPLPSSSSIAKSMSYSTSATDDAADSVGNPVDPSIILATMMNTYEGMICMNVSMEVKQAVAGFQDSSVRVFRLDPQETSDVDQDSAQDHNGSSSMNPFGKTLINYGGTNSIAMSMTLPHIPKLTHQDHMDETFNVGESNVLELRGHSASVYAVDQDLTERLILSGSSDEYVRLWDTHLAQCVAKYSVEAPIWDVKFSPIGYYFASANMDHSLHIYSIDQKSPLRILNGHSRDVTSCCWHDNISLILSGSDDKTARLWDIRTPNSPVRIFRGCTSSISTVKCSPFGNLVAAGLENGTAQLWDVGSGKSLAYLQSDSIKQQQQQQQQVSSSMVYNPIHSIAFSLNSEVLCAGSSDCSVKLWDLRNLKMTMQTLYKSNPHHQSNVEEHVLKSRHVFNTKFTPVYHVHYTSRNLLVAGGPFALERAIGCTSLDTSLANATEKEALTALGLTHPVPI